MKALTTMKIQEVSVKDPELIEVRKAIESGHFEKCMTYAAVVSELEIIRFLVLCGKRIVFTKTLQFQTFVLTHDGYILKHGKIHADV